MNPPDNRAPEVILVGPSDDTEEWSVRVGSSGPREARSYARQHVQRVGPALSFDDQEPNITALEQVLGALGAELVTGLTGLARRRRLALDDVEVLSAGQVSGTLRYLGVVGATTSPRVASLSLRVFVSSDESDAAIDDLWQEVRQRSPLLTTFAAMLPVELSLIRV